MTALVNRLPHYNSHPSGIECRSVNRHLSAPLSCAYKYLFRYREKGNPAKDLRKCQNYIEDQIEHLGMPARVSEEVVSLAAGVAEAEPDQAVSRAMMLLVRPLHIGHLREAAELVSALALLAEACVEPK